MSDTLTPAERTELLRLADGYLTGHALTYAEGHALICGVPRLLADLAQVEGEREEARLHRDQWKSYCEGARETVARLAFALPTDKEIADDEDAAVRAGRVEADLSEARAEADRLLFDLQRARDVAHAADIVHASETQRLRDLVRHQRGELHDAGLLTDEEYAALAGDHGAVARMEGYDRLRADLAEMRAEVERLRGAASPYPVLDVLRKLADAADHLHAAHDCDAHGWETWREAARWARVHADAIERGAHIATETPDAR